MTESLRLLMRLLIGSLKPSAWRASGASRRRAGRPGCGLPPLQGRTHPARLGRRAEGPEPREARRAELRRS
jgi:hypothetical protein